MPGVSEKKAPRPRLRFSLPIDPARLLRARHRIRDYLHAQGLESRVIDDVVLAVQEAMSNAVLHSRTTDDLEIVLAFAGDDLVVEVRDRGKGFDTSCFDPHQLPDPDRSSGRGLYLIAQLMDELELCCDAGLQIRATRRHVLSPVSNHRESNPAALAHEDARRLALLEEIDEGYYALDWEYRFTMANSAYQRLVGRDAQTLLGRTLWEAFPRLTDHEAGQAVRDAMELGRPAMLEYLSPSLNRWFELRAYPAATGVLVYSRDVDERKRKELDRDALMAALTASEASFSAIFEESPTAIALASMPDGIFVRVNRAFELLSGYTREELIGSRGLELGIPGAAEDTELKTIFAAEGRVRDYECVRTTKSRRRLMVSISLDLVTVNGEKHVLITLRDLTQGRMAEEALRDSEQRLRMHLENTPLAVVEWDKDFIVTRWAGEAERIFGWSQQETAGRPIMDLHIIHEDDVAVVERTMAHLTDGSSTQVVSSNRNITKDGRVIHCTWYNSVLQDAGGRMRSVMSLVVDNTERHRTEQALRESERLLRTVFENSLDGINMLDLATGRYVLLSPAQVAMTGFTKEELDGITAEEAYERTHPEDREVTVLQQQRVAAGEDSGEPVEYRWMVKSGEYRWFSDRRRLVRDAEGTAVALVGVSRDVTERKGAEEALRRGEERFRALFESMTEGVALHEVVYSDGRAVDYRIMQVNPAYERQTGLSNSEVVGQLASHVYGTGEPPYLAEYARVAEDGESLSLDTYFPPLRRSFRIAVVSPARGQFATIFEDITERKRAEETLRRSREDLDRAQAVGQIGSWRLDVRHNVLVWSDENYRIFGLPMGMPLTYETFLAAVHPEDRGLVNAYWTAALKDEPYDVEHRILVGGDVRWVREKAYLERDEAGNVTGGFGITQDITESKMADVERLRLLAESQALAEMLQRQSGELQDQAETLTKRAHLAEVLNAINDEIHAALAFDEVVQGALDGAVLALKFTGGTIEMREGSSWVVRYQHGFPNDVGLHMDDREAQIATHAETTLRTFAIADTRTAPGQDVGFIRRRGLRSALAVPLLSRGVVIGCLLLFDKQPHAFSDLEIDFGRKLGATISLALENARLHRAQVEAADRARFEAELSQTLLDAANTISSSLSLSDVLDRLLDVILTRTGRPRAFLNALDDERRELVVMAGKGPYLPPAGTVVPYDRLSPTALRAVTERRTQVLDYDADAASRPAASRYHSHLVLYVPLFSGQRMIGHISVDSAERNEPFSDGEVELVQGIAAEAAISIENARLYEAQRRIATTLQENLMHPLPSIPDLDLAAVSQPAFEPELVGGDFHDVFLLPEGSVVALIGDVMGKGVEAAGLTETTRSAVRALALAGLPAEEILRHTNQVLLSETHDQFVSALMIMLDPATGHCLLASAGHPAPALLSADGSRFVEPGYGPLLGVFESGYSVREFMLEPGETLLLYTDGLIEARRGHEQFGETRLLEALRGAHGPDARSIVDHMRDVALAFAGTLRDDLEIMAVRRERVIE